jgi:hypothetical protein
VGYSKTVQPAELAFLLAAGAAFIAFGLVPRLLQDLEDGIRNLSALLWFSFPQTHHAQPVNKSGRVWLVATGLAVITASSLLAISK